jgi:hypothetical protein
MRCMVIVKADKDSEAGVMPSREILTAMGKFNEELVKAGVMLAGEGLHPTSKGKRVRVQGGKHTITDGPFAETKELIAGFWLWQVRSMDEAIEWLKRSPFDGGTEIEIRQVFETEDFGAELTPELRAQEDRLRQQNCRKKITGGPISRRSVLWNDRVGSLESPKNIFCRSDKKPRPVSPKNGETRTGHPSLFRSHAVRTGSAFCPASSAASCEKADQSSDSPPRASRVRNRL